MLDTGTRDHPSWEKSLAGQGPNKRDCLVNGVSADFISRFLIRGQRSANVIAKAPRGRLPPCDPACLTFAGRVQRTGHQVQTLERGLLAREMTARFLRPPIARFERLNCIGRAYDSTHLRVVVKKGMNSSHALSTAGCRRVPLAPVLGQLAECSPRRCLARRSVDQFDNATECSQGDAPRAETYCGSDAQHMSGP